MSTTTMAVPHTCDRCRTPMSVESRAEGLVWRAIDGGKRCPDDEAFHTVAGVDPFTPLHP